MWAHRSTPQFPHTSMVRLAKDRLNNPQNGGRPSKSGVSYGRAHKEPQAAVGASITARRAGLGAGNYDCAARPSALDGARAGI